MTPLLISQEEANTLYKQLAVNDMLILLIAGDNKQLYANLTATSIGNVIGEFGHSKMDDPFFTASRFKEELKYGLNNCLLDEDLTKEAGVLWFAKGSTVIDVLEAISYELVKQLDKVELEMKQAKYN